jgi:GNAT superfamily N-acetyltransferase
VLTVRLARAGDIEALGLVADAAYRPYLDRIGRAPAPMTADYTAAVARHRTWVAVLNGTVVGFIVLVREPDHLLVENVAVLPDQQGWGTGSKLLRVAEQDARRFGLREIRLYTNAAMTENLAFYANRGYTETHRAHDEGFDRVFFRKPVADMGWPD